MEKQFESLMNGKQKGLAAVLAVGALGIILFLIAPILTVILKSLVLTLVLVGICLFLALNWQTLFRMFKLLSWKMTKAWIGLDKMAVLEQGLQVAYEKQEKMALHHNQITATRIETERRLAEITARFNKNKAEAIALEKRVAQDPKFQSALDLTLHKVKTDKDILDNLIPRLEFIEKGVDQMGELRELLGHKVKSMEYTVESKRNEYETLKELNKASNTLKDFMSDNNQDAKIFNEGLRQTEQSISEFIANIENLDKDIQPALMTLQSQKLGDIEAGRQLIEDYKKTLSTANFDGK